MATYPRVRGTIAATLLAMVLAGCAGSDTKRSTGDYVDDSALTAKVKTELLKDPVVKGTSVNVETFKGTVQLSGFVANEQERMRAGEIARDVNGVARVRNDLRVKGQ